MVHRERYIFLKIGEYTLFADSMALGSGQNEPKFDQTVPVSVALSEFHLRLYCDTSTKFDDLVN